MRLRARDIPARSSSISGGLTHTRLRRGAEKTAKAARSKRSLGALTFVFMNEKIRERVPSGPVIRAVRGRSVKESNLLRLMVAGREVGRVVFDPSRSPVKTHEVKAWIELNGAVEVVAA